MKKTDMLRRLKLSEQAFEDIQAAVDSAEKHTTGEIALAVTAESARYSSYELMYALGTGVLFFALLLPFAGSIQHLLDKLLWGGGGMASAGILRYYVFRDNSVAVSGGKCAGC